MADSWNWPALINKIAQDVPFLQRALNALLKQDPTSIEDAPSGAKRLYEVSSGKWQWQEYNGSSWAAVPFLQHNVDQLDGYHAAITPAANTVAVRNSAGLLEDSITGNAATASTATTLSQTLQVSKGGTGATSSEQARANLGVPPTSHASTNTTHGVGNATQYGHLKLSDATDDMSGVSGGVAATPAAVKAAKEAADAAQSSANNAQSSADAAMTKASTIATSSTPGIVKPGTGMTVDAAGALNVSLNNTVTSTSTTQSATANAVKTAYDKAVEANEKATIQKLFNSRVVITESNTSWNPPVTGWARVTVIGGGGGGGKGGGLGKGGSGGRQGGNSSFGTITASGGSGGGGGNASAGGGGGESGEIKTEFVFVDSNPVKIVIGAGGAGGNITQSGLAGTKGQGPHGGGVCSIGTQGGGGAPGAGNGNNHEAENSNTASPGVGGPGATTKMGYGGGGGGGAGGLGLVHTTSGGAATDSAARGGDSSDSNGSNGGAGGQGAVIIEYYDPNKEAV